MVDSRNPGISSNVEILLSARSNSGFWISRASSSTFFAFDIFPAGIHDTGAWFIARAILHTRQYALNKHARNLPQLDTRHDSLTSFYQRWVGRSLMMGEIQSKHAPQITASSGQTTELYAHFFHQRFCWEEYAIAQRTQKTCVRTKLHIAGRKQALSGDSKTGDTVLYIE